MRAGDSAAVRQDPCYLSDREQEYLVLESGHTVPLTITKLGSESMLALKKTMWLFLLIAVGLR